MRDSVHDAVQEITPNPLILDVDAECPTRECANRQARDANADFLLHVQVRFEQRDYTIDIVAVAADDERQLAHAEGICRLCGQAELLAEVATQVKALRPVLGPALGDDDRSAAASPPVTSEPLRLVAPARARRLEAGGWVGVALGLAGVGAGAALIAVDGHEHGPTCTIDVRDQNGACPNVYTTEVAGIVGVSLGGAALATGLGLLISAASKRGEHRSARVRPTLGGLRLEF